MNFLPRKAEDFVKAEYSFVSFCIKAVLCVHKEIEKVCKAECTKQ